MNRFEQRAQILFDYGASVAVTDVLLAYTQPPDESVVSLATQISLAPELHVEAWRGYAAEAVQSGVLPALQKRLPQLRFPIQAGVSQSEPYHTATRAGSVADGGGIALEHPEGLQLRFHQTVAGAIPVLIPQGRHDFVALVQAFAKKNEPTPILDSMGACIILGYINWDRIHTLRREWEATNGYPPAFAEVYWKQEWRDHIMLYKSLYQDTFIILSDGDYSGISAEAMGRPAGVWREESLQIRLEHEGMHYVMRRLMPVRPSPIIEEMLADLRGMAAVWGTYDAKRFLHFIGLENFPHYREGGRLDLYRGTPPLPEEAFVLLRQLVRDAALHLEYVYNQHAAHWATDAGQVQLALAISCLSLEELASSHYYEYLSHALRHIGGEAAPMFSIPVARLVSAGG